MRDEQIGFEVIVRMNYAATLQNPRGGPGL